MGGANPPAFPFQGGNGTCQVTASRPDCSWTAVTNANWIDIQNGGGSGSGTVGFTVQPNPTLAARSGTIRLLEGSQPSCSITQAAAVLAGTVDEPVLGWTSDLQVPGGRGQVVVDGTHATFHESGARQGWAESRASRHRIEGTLVTADGRAGTWRFRLEGPLAPGSLRVIAGEVAAIAADTITFRLAGRPGERVVFTFVGR